MKTDKFSLMKKTIPYLYLAPALIVIAAMMGFPIIYNVVISFFNWDISKPVKPFVGFENYAGVITDAKFVKVLLNTLVWTVGGVVLQLIIGLVTALFIQSIKRGKVFLQSAILLPWVIPGVVTALIWGWMLQSDLGIINNLIWDLGLTKNNIVWLGDEKFAMLSVIAINTWKAAPFWFLMLTAGLQDLPAEQVESAKIDGARYLNIFRNVVIPHLTPIIAATGVITTIWTLNYFDLIWVTTKGGPMDSTSTLPIYTYRLGFEFYDFGKSSALSIISLFVIFLVCIPYIKGMMNGLKEEGALK